MFVWDRRLLLAYTGRRVVDQLNHQAREISQDFLSDKFDFVEGTCKGLLNM